MVEHPTLRHRDSQPPHRGHDPAPQRQPQRRLCTTDCDGSNLRIRMPDPPSSIPSDFSAGATVQPPTRSCWRSCCRRPGTEPIGMPTTGVECDPGRLKARLGPMRGFKQDRSARVVVAGHGFVQNLSTRPLRARGRGASGPSGCGRVRRVGLGDLIVGWRHGVSMLRADQTQQSPCGVLAWPCSASSSSSAQRRNRRAKTGLMRCLGELPVGRPPVAFQHPGVVGAKHHRGVVEAAACCDLVDDHALAGERPQPCLLPTDPPAGLVPPGVTARPSWPSRRATFQDGEGIDADLPVVC